VANMYIKDEVILVHYQSDWILKYEAESTLLVSVLGDTLLNIYHIGSTSVPNLTSKPIIDILAEVHSLKQLDMLELKFMELGYELKGENGIPNRQYYVKRKDGKRAIHLHCYAKGNPEIGRHLKFKSILLENKNILMEYEKLKIDQAAKYKDDRLKYTEAKSEFIRNVLLNYE
jgi:GrpB-like predicted nucleotidyltransferase (UPF0157 family)